jgi:hypothetical protein
MCGTYCARVTDRRAVPARHGLGQSCVGDRVGCDPVARCRAAAARGHRHVWSQQRSRERHDLHTSGPRSIPYSFSCDVFALVVCAVEGQHRSDELVWKASWHCFSEHALCGGRDRARAARWQLMDSINSVRDCCFTDEVFFIVCVRGPGICMRSRVAVVFIVTVL